MFLRPMFVGFTPMRARQLVIASDGLDLVGELVEADGDPTWTAVLCHGISGRTRAPDDPGYAGLARTLAGTGITTAWLNFRGVRESPGDFSVGGWVRDLGAAIDVVMKDARAPLVLIGSSAGGATAIAVAAERNDVAAVVTLASPATYDGLSADPTAAAHELRNLGIIRDPAYPQDLAAWAAEFERFAPVSLVGAIAPRPILIVHGDADDIVPYPHAERLFEQAREPKELVRLPNGGHQLRLDARALEAVTDWLERIRISERG